MSLGLQCIGLEFALPEKVACGTKRKYCWETKAWVDDVVFKLVEGSDGKRVGYRLEEEASWRGEIGAQKY
jgi:hypothetical protein